MRSDLVVSHLVSWFHKNARDLPWRRDRNAYRVWISEMMLQQTQVKTVVPYFERWLARFPDIEAVAQAPSESILKAWEGLGYYSRARNIHAAAQTILASHGGVFPTTYDEVLDLPGVGPYSAGAICSIAFNQPTPAVDGNVVRVLARLCALGESGPELRRIIVKQCGVLMRTAQSLSHSGAKQTKRSCATLTEALMELGATICLPRNPNCPACPVKMECRAFHANTTDKYPALVPRAAAVARQYCALLLVHRDCVLARLRKPGVVNSGLWEFPNLETTGKDSQAFLRSIKIPLTKICTLRHSITTSRIELDAFRADLRTRSVPQIAGLMNGTERWLSYQEIRDLPLTGAHRKVFTLFENSGLSN